MKILLWWYLNLLNVYLLLLPDALDFIMQQDKVRIELINHVFINLSKNILMVELSLLLGNIGNYLTHLLVQNLVFMRPYLLDI